MGRTGGMRCLTPNDMDGPGESMLLRIPNVAIVVPDGDRKPMRAARAWIPFPALGNDNEQGTTGGAARSFFEFTSRAM